MDNVRGTTKQVGKFAVVGIINTLVDVVILNFLVFSGLTAAFVLLGQKFLAANIISVFIAMIGSFILNKLWTFESRKGNIYRQVLSFFVVTVIGMFVIHQLVFNFFYFNLEIISSLVVSIVQLAGLDQIFPDDFVVLNFAKGAALAASLVWNFLGYKFLVFKAVSDQSSAS